jgi:hypothetical protein
MSSPHSQGEQSRDLSRDSRRTIMDTKIQLA